MVRFRPQFFFYYFVLLLGGWGPLKHGLATLYIVPESLTTWMTLVQQLIAKTTVDTMLHS